MLREELKKVHTVECKDEETALTILSGLLLAYENFVRCLTINLRTAKLEDVKSNLINEEKRRQEKKVDKKNTSNENEQMFHSKYKADKKKRNVNDVQCYKCEKFGHYARNYNAPKKEKANYKMNAYDKANSKSDTEILPSKRSRKQTKRYVPGESMTKMNKSNQQKLANLVNIIDDEP
jgi:hypothetical protein